jgi:hypothetical protein
MSLTVSARPLSLIAAVQVDQRGARAAVAHPVHQLALRLAPGVRGERVARMPQVMKMDAGQPGRRHGREPDAPPEIAVMQRAAARAGEQQVIGRGGEPIQTATQFANDDRRDDYYAVTRSGLRPMSARE